MGGADIVVPNAKGTVLAVAGQYTRLHTVHADIEDKTPDVVQVYAQRAVLKVQPGTARGKERAAAAGRPRRRDARSGARADLAGAYLPHAAELGIAQKDGGVGAVYAALEVVEGVGGRKGRAAAQRSS